MWDVGVGRARESNGGTMGTTVIDQQFKKFKKDDLKKTKVPKWWCC